MNFTDLQHAVSSWFHRGPEASRFGRALLGTPVTSRALPVEPLGIKDLMSSFMLEIKHFDTRLDRTVEKLGFKE